MFMVGRSIWIPSILLLVFCFMTVYSRSYTGEAQATAKQPDLYQQAKDKALTWLKGQMVPNETVPDPILDRRRLLISYEMPQDDPRYRYIYSRSAIYDNAIAAVAFTMAGEGERAAMVLSALSRLVHQDGGLWFGYNTANAWPTEGDSDTALYRSGAIAWVGYAITFYLHRGLKDNPRLLSEDRRAQSLLAAALSIGDYLLRLQVGDASDRRWGLITGGEGEFAIKFVEGKVVEEYQGGAVAWASTEHNMDAYFFLRDLARISKEGKYERASEMIQEALVKVAWSTSDGQYYRGVRQEGLDTALALDGASWGAMFSLAVGEQDRAKQSLQAIERSFQSADMVGSQEVRGYKPYTRIPVYEDRAVREHLFPTTPNITWTDLRAVWGEGSLGVAMAYLKLGETDKAKAVADEMIKLQQEGGGVLYITKEVPHEFTNAPSVASTAWLAMVLSAMQNNTILDDFWGRE